VGNDSMASVAESKAAQSSEQRHHSAGLRTVASLEFGKGLIVLLLGFGAVSLVHRDAWDVAESMLRMLRISPGHHYAQVFLNLADNVTDAKLWALAAGATAYSVLRFIEAYGLWNARAWAEWFALISGAVYVPFEAYELIRRPTLVHVAVLVVNVGIVLYMVYLRMAVQVQREKT
jgi:uncharacterized membrane protein (DUF2068 family)